MLSDEQRKVLRAAHPLYRRLSGEVVWLALEEAGCDAEQCARWMDRFIAQMERTLRVMHALETAPEKAFKLQCGNECAACMPLHGVIISGTCVNWHTWMPPYGIGCRARARLVADCKDVPLHIGTVTVTQPPQCLICPHIVPHSEVLLDEDNN